MAFARLLYGLLCPLVADLGVLLMPRSAVETVVSGLDLLRRQPAQLDSKRLVVGCGLGAVALGGFGDVAEGPRAGRESAARYSSRSAWISGVA